MTDESSSASTSRRLSEAVPYSYRADPAVPAFPDDKALVVFDGVCVLCSGFAKFILKRDKTLAIRLATAQSPLGQALYRHYGLDAVEFESNLVLADGRAYAKLIPNAEFRLVPQAGHYPQIEQADETVGCIAAFVARFGFTKSHLFKTTTQGFSAF